jgi:hypothetical protein
MKGLIAVALIAALTSTLSIYRLVQNKNLKMSNLTSYYRTPFYYHRFENRPAEPLKYSRAWFEYLKRVKVPEHPY